MQPKQIARRAQCSYEAVKKWLQRSNGKHVVNEGAGWYRARATAALLKKIGFEPLQVHALKIKVPKTLKSLRRGGTPALAGLGKERVLRDGSTQREGDWRGRKVTVQSMSDGGSYVSIGASTDPISCHDFAELAEWIAGMAYPETPMLDDVDLNVDAAQHRLKLSGVESVSLGDWTSNYVKAYNKQCMGVARIEACYHRLNAPLSEVARMLHDLAAVPPGGADQYRPELMPSPLPWEAA